MTGIDPQLVESLPIEEGTIIAGKYRVDSLLAAGGMGAVVKARHEVLEQDVAIKLMRPELMNDREAAQRFLREARAAAKITSDYVARVSDVDLLEDGTPFMVMEFLHGDDLDVVLEEEGKMPVKVAVDYAMQALSGLDAAHRLGVVHRDLKPSNLFLVDRPDGTRRVKLLDFGISKVLDHRGTDGLKAGATTSSDAVLGTPRYMSPEQVSSAKDVDARTDIWALGLILYQMLTNHFPFEGETAGAVLANVLTATVPPVAERRPELSPLLSQAVMRCLNRDREQRFANARALMVALAPYASRRTRAQLMDTDETPPAVTGALGTPQVVLASGDDDTVQSDRGQFELSDGDLDASKLSGKSSKSVPAATAPTLRQHAPDTVTNMELETTAAGGNRRLLLVAGMAVLLLGGGLAWWAANGSNNTPVEASNNTNASSTETTTAPAPASAPTVEPSALPQPAASSTAEPAPTAAESASVAATAEPAPKPTRRVVPPPPPPPRQPPPPPPPPTSTSSSDLLGTRE